MESWRNAPISWMRGGRAWERCVSSWKAGLLWLPGPGPRVRAAESGGCVCVAVSCLYPQPHELCVVTGAGLVGGIGFGPALPQTSGARRWAGMLDALAASQLEHSFCHPGFDSAGHLCSHASLHFCKLNLGFSDFILPLLFPGPARPALSLF